MSNFKKVLGVAAGVMIASQSATFAAAAPAETSTENTPQNLNVTTNSANTTVTAADVEKAQRELKASERFLKETAVAQGIASDNLKSAEKDLKAKEKMAAEAKAAEEKLPRVPEADLMKNLQKSKKLIKH